MTDLHFFLQSIVPFSKEGTIPLFLMGHSMGGMNVLYYALNPESPYHKQTTSSTKVKVTGIISIAPLVAVHPATQPPKIIEYLGRLAQLIVPKMTMKQKVEPQWVSRNPAVRVDIENDHGVMFHNIATLEGLAGMLDRATYLNELHKKKKQHHELVAAENIPALWVGHGSEDRITWFDASKRLVESLDTVKDKTFKNYKDAYHKLMNESEGVGEEMTRDVTEWIKARIPHDEA